MRDLKKEENEDYAQQLLRSLEGWVEKSRSKLDPKEFRSLYIKKIAQDQHSSSKNQRGLLMGQKKLTMISAGTQIETSGFEEPEEGQTSLDTIGLAFYEINQGYRRKFWTMSSHLQFDHHPIRKLLDEYRRQLEDFIKDKNRNIE